MLNPLFGGKMRATWVRLSYFHSIILLILHHTPTQVFIRVDAPFRVPATSIGGLGMYNVVRFITCFRAWPHAIAWALMLVTGMLPAAVFLALLSAAPLVHAQAQSGDMFYNKWIESTPWYELYGPGYAVDGNDNTQFASANAQGPFWLHVD